MDSLFSLLPPSVPLCISFGTPLYTPYTLFLFLGRRAAIPTTYMHCLACMPCVSPCTASASASPVCIYTICSSLPVYFTAMHTTVYMCTTHFLPPPVCYIYVSCIYTLSRTSHCLLSALLHVLPCCFYCTTILLPVALFLCLSGTLHTTYYTCLFSPFYSLSLFCTYMSVSSLSSSCFSVSVYLFFLFLSSTVMGGTVSYVLHSFTHYLPLPDLSASHMLYTCMPPVTLLPVPVPCLLSPSCCTPAHCLPFSLSLYSVYHFQHVYHVPIILLWDYSRTLCALLGPSFPVPDMPGGRGRTDILSSLSLPLWEGGSPPHLLYLCLYHTHLPPCLMGISSVSPSLLLWGGGTLHKL